MMKSLNIQAPIAPVLQIRLGNRTFLYTDATERHLFLTHRLTMYELLKRMGDHPMPFCLHRFDDDQVYLDEVVFEPERGATKVSLKTIGSYHTFPLQEIEHEKID